MMLATGPGARVTAPQLRRRHSLHFARRGAAAAPCARADSIVTARAASENKISCNRLRTIVCTEMACSRMSGDIARAASPLRHVSLVVPIFHRDIARHQRTQCGFAASVRPPERPA